MAPIHIHTDENLKEVIVARNKINKVCNLIQPQIIETLRPFRGKKIIKVTPYRTLMSKVFEVLNPVLEEYRKSMGGMYILDYQSNYSLSLRVEILYKLHYDNGVEVQHSLSDYLYLGLLENNTYLKDEDVEICVRKEDYDFEEIRLKILQLKQLEEQFDALKSELSLFLR
jgi:hypothetical protein